MAALLVAGSKLAQTNRLRLSFRRRGEPARSEPSAAAAEKEEEIKTIRDAVELLPWTEIGKKKQAPNQVFNPMLT